MYLYRKNFSVIYSPLTDSVLHFFRRNTSLFNNLFYHLAKLIRSIPLCDRIFSDFVFLLQMLYNKLTMTCENVLSTNEEPDESFEDLLNSMTQIIERQKSILRSRGDTRSPSEGIQRIIDSAREIQRRASKLKTDMVKYQ